MELRGEPESGLEDNTCEEGKATRTTRHGREPVLGLHNALGIAICSLCELFHSVLTIKTAW